MAGVHQGDPTQRRRPAARLRSGDVRDRLVAELGEALDGPTHTPGIVGDDGWDLRDPAVEKDQRRLPRQQPDRLV